MTKVPTRWRTTLEDQLRTAEERVALAEGHLESGDGGRALQEAYPAVVAAATVRTWLTSPPWIQPLAPDELQRRVRQAFPHLFSALASLDLKHALTSPWQADAAKPYVREARMFLGETKEQLESWLAQN